LVNNSNAARFANLTPGMTINLDTLTSLDINIEATVSSPLGISRVDFQLDDGPVHDEGFAPYALCGDWSSCPANTLTALGTHTLIVKPYDAIGVLGMVSTISFSVVGTPPPACTNGSTQVASCPIANKNMYQWCLLCLL
jgi:hypothetical protein